LPGTLHRKRPDTVREWAGTADCYPVAPLRSEWHDGTTGVFTLAVAPLRRTHPSVVPD
jgi:hypothetical protein